MANIHPEIKPTGVQDKYLIDLMYMLQQSLYILCLKLDDDATAGTGYVAACYTAIYREQIWDYRGNKTQNVTVTDHIITPAGGLSSAALNQWIYDHINALETLTEACDTDSLNTSDYEDNCYEACVLPFMAEDKTGSILGNDVSTGGITGVDTGGPPWRLSKIGPIGKPSDRILADIFYSFINAWETLCEQLDVDAATTPPTDTDYEALCYTATVLMKVENSSGSVLGNAQTRLG